MRSARHLARWSRERFQPAWQRRLAVAGLVLLAALGLGWLVWLAAGLYVDLLWFRGLGYGGVYQTRLTSQVLLFLAGAGLFAALYFGNLRLAHRFGQANGASGSGDDALWTYLARVSAGLSDGSGRARQSERILLGLGIPLTLALGLRLAAGWDRWLLALNGGSFSLAEPFFGRDAGFYVFALPVLRGAHGWLSGSLTIVALATLLACLGRSWLEYGLRPRQALAELGRPARLQLAGLGAALFGLLALHHQLSLAETVFATSGQAFRLTFPGYVEATARPLALWAMTLGALAGGALLLWSASRRSFRGLLLGPALWLATLLLGTFYPPLVQTLVVKPNEAVVERPYLAQVMRMARFAYGLDGLVERSIPTSEPLRAEAIQNHLTTLGNLRLWEPEPLRLVLNQLQAGRPYFDFPLYPDLDRYTLDGQPRPLQVAVRELEPASLSARSWVNTRLQFTHGYGLVATAANAVAPDGRPVLVERDIPPQGPLGLVRPEVYFGERTGEPALVRPVDSALEASPADENTRAPYRAQAGVPLGNPLSRLAHALRLADLNLLLSPTIGPDTGLLHGRQIAERVQRLAPFLLLDADPYPVVVDGRLVWLLDGYTASDHFPLSPPPPAHLLAANPLPQPRLGPPRMVEPNYLRGAVKATVDAYDGSVNFYLAGPRDPIAAAYARLYPELLQPFEALPTGLRGHLRYPQQLFGVQADALARLHVSDPAQLYSGEDAWLVARGRFETRPDTRPLYGLQRLPGQQAEEFVLTIPYRPYSQANDRHNLVALLAARSDADGYGELLLYHYPRERPVEGPFQAELRIDQDPTVSAQFGLWQRAGAQIIRGDIQTVPLDNSLLFVESVYLQRAERAGLPELQRIIAVSGGRVAMEPSLEAALSSLLGSTIDLGKASGQTAGRSDQAPSARDLALSAQSHLQRAQEALFAGDRARHDQELQAAQTDLQRLAETSR